MEVEVINNLNLSIPPRLAFFRSPALRFGFDSAHYTHRVVSLAVRLVVEDGLAYRIASWHLWRDHRVFVPFATIQNWVASGGAGEAGGKKGGALH